MPQDTKTPEEEWREMLIHGHPVGRLARRVFRVLPRSPRCKLCAAPFVGPGGFLMRQIGRPRSRKNPRYCEPCEMQQPGGAEVEISMLFADVRGSTRLAESMSAAEFSHMIGHFYEVATDILVQEDALVDRLVGDEVVGLFVPGWAGPKHGEHAIRAARKLIEQLGYGSKRGPRLPVGIGVHTGIAFVGVVKGGEEGLSDFTALGDNVNVAARLASEAASGEILVSEATLQNAGMATEGLERRTLSLKGKAEKMTVRVLRHERWTA